MTIETTYHAIFDQLDTLVAAHGITEADLGRAAASLLRRQEPEAPFDQAGELQDAVVRLVWALVIRETAVDHAGLIMGSMRLELLAAEGQTLAEVRDDLLASAALHPRWVVGRTDVRLPDAWIHSANACREVLRWSGADLRLLLDQPMADWRGPTESFEALRREASEQAVRLLSRGDVREDYLPPDDVEAWVTRALALHGQGRSAEAADDLRTARGAGLPEGRMRAMLAMMRRENGELEAAIEAWDQALAAGVDNEADVQYDRALTLSELGELDSALDGYDVAIRLRPEWTAPRLNKGVLLSRAGLLQPALEVLQQAIDLDGEDAELHYNVSHVRSQLGDEAGALEALDRAVALMPGYAAAHNNRGVLRRHMGDLEGALADFTEALSGEDHSRTRVNRAGVAVDLERWDVALTDADALLAAYPAAAQAHVIRGRACEGLGRRAQAVQAFVAALRHADEGEDAITAAEAGLERLAYKGPRAWPLPTSPALAVVRAFLDGLSDEARDAVLDAMTQANAALLEHSPTDALPLLDDAIAAAPSYFEPWLQRASAHMMRSDFEAAILDNARALDLCPSADMGWAQRADIEAMRGRLDEALVAIERAVELFPTQTLHLLKRSFLRGQSGDMDGSIADLRHILELDPAHEDALYNLAHALQGEGNVQEAIEVYTQALAIRPDDVQAFLNRGTARVGLGDIDGGMADFDAAIAADPEYAFAFAKRGLVLSITGQHWPAAFDLLMALLVAPEDWAMADMTRESFAGVMAELRESGAVATDAVIAAIVSRYVDLGVDQRALSVLEAFEDDLSTLAEYWSQRGRLLLMDDHPEEATEAWQRALGIDARCASAGYHLGVALQDEGDAERALPTLQEAIADRRPWDTWPLSRAHFRCGQAALDLAQPQDAVAAFETAATTDPAWTEAHFKLAFARDLAGDVEGSIAAYSRAIELDPSASTAWFNRACEHARAHHRQEALADLAEAVSLDDSWAEAAWEDDYFAPLWDDPAFAEVVGPRPEMDAEDDD